jgi:hypothetical protein
MSSIHNRIVTTYSANAGNALAVQGEMTGSLLGMGRAGLTSGQNIGIAERQWRAFGTTLRYAIAGTAIFAGPAMVRNLSQFQQQLGLISAIGSGPGGIPIVGAQLEHLGTQATNGAVKAITPINDFNDAVVNFLSTVQNVPEDQITPIVTDIAQAARIAQIPVEDATKAFTTMSVAFGRKVTRPDVRRTAQEFFILTKEAPGGRAAGPQIIGQIGQLSQVTRLAGGNRPELFGLLLSALRSGIPPSQVGRGLQFLIQTVGLPGQQTKESEQALGSVGIRAGARMPLMERLNRIFTHARKLSVTGDLSKVGNLSDETLDDLDASGAGSSKAMKDLGITGPGAVFLGQIFHRVHALRTAIALLGQVNVGQYQKDIKTMTDAEQGHVKEIDDLAKQWENFRKEAQLAEAGVKLQRLGLQVARIFQPIFNFGARGLGGLSDTAGRHPDATRDAVIGAAGLLGVIGARRFLKTGGLGIGRLLGRGAGAAGVAAAGENLLTGGVPTGKASDPIFVVVLSQLGGRGGTLQYPSPIGPQRGGGRGISPFFGAGLLSAASVAAIMSTPGDSGNRGESTNWVKKHYPTLFSMGVQHINKAGGFVFRQGVSNQTKEMIANLHREHGTGVVNRILRDRMTRIYTNQGGSVAGMNASQIAVALQGRVTLDIDYNNPDGSRKTKKVHVRVDNWDNGNRPQHRGRHKTTRR